jgi:hypothetical protein
MDYERVGAVGLKGVPLTFIHFYTDYKVKATLQEHEGTSLCGKDPSLARNVRQALFRPPQVGNPLCDTTVLHGIGTTQVHPSLLET